jgi:Tol biopolymer transport system component
LRNDLRALRDDLSSGEHASPVSSSGISSPVLPPSGTTSYPPSAIGAVDGPRAWRRFAVGGALVLVLAAAAAVAWRATRPSAPTDSATGSHLFAGMSLSRLTTTGTAGLAAVSADGRYVAHVVTDDAGRSLWLRQVATSSNVQIVPPADVRYAGISFSPDGDHVYYVTYPRGAQFAALTQVPVLGGGTRKVIDDVDSAPTFSPDGKRLAFVRGLLGGGALVMMADLDGGNLRQIAERKPPLDFAAQSQTISWSPDGRLLAVAGEDSSKLQGQIVLVDVESGSERVLTGSEWRAVTSLAWAPDGSGIVANAQEAGSESSSSQIWFIGYADGVGQRLTNDLSSYGGLSLSRDGRTVVTVRGEQRASIWVVPATDKGQARTVTTGAGADDGVLGLSWAPDGRIVYASTASGNSDIYVMNADGTNRVPLTTSKSDDMLPHVTRDGRHVVYVSEEGGSRGVWRVDVSGGGFVRLGTDSLSRSPWGPTLSADGKWAFFSNDGAVARKVAIDGSSAADVFTSTGGANLPPGFHDPNLSPDGRTIAGHYRDEAARGEHLALVPLDDPGRFKLMPTVPNNAQWSPDSRSLLYFDTQRGASNLYRQPVAGGPPVRLTHFEDLRIFRFELSPDEKQIVLSRGATISDVVLMTARERAGAGQP